MYNIFHCNIPPLKKTAETHMYTYVCEGIMMGEQKPKNSYKS